jgi:predicted DNA-binding transcriptional regulator AlpA
MAANLSPPAAAPAIYLDAKGCGARYGVSSRHWLRLVDAGKAPQPTRFGRCVRWGIELLETWEAAGCPSCGKGGRRD